MERTRGEFLWLFIGNMASEKTGHLILEVTKLRERSRKKVVVFKPNVDTRSSRGFINSRRGETLEAYDISPQNPREEVLRILKQQEDGWGVKFDVVAFDEVQFFPKESGFFWLVKELLQKGYNIIAAGLALDFRGEPVGSTLWLAALAQDSCTWEHAYCTGCGKPAIFPQRFLHNGELAPYEDELIIPGSEDKRFRRYYEARCEDCFVIPPKIQK
ncbi:MAG: thymidine kinase [bacterium]